MELSISRMKALVRATEEKEAAMMQVKRGRSVAVRRVGVGVVVVVARVAI